MKQRTVYLLCLLLAGCGNPTGPVIEEPAPASSWFKVCLKADTLVTEKHMLVFPNCGKVTW